MSHKRDADAWALRIQLEKEEQRVAELKANEKLLHERIAHLEDELAAERTTRRTRQEWNRVTLGGRPVGYVVGFDESGRESITVAVPSQQPTLNPPGVTVEPTSTTTTGPTRWSLLELD